MTIELSGLPDEILQCILSFASPQAAVSLGRTSKRFTDVSNEPLIWRDYCLMGYRYWDSKHNIHRISSNLDSVNWKELYAERQATDRKTAALLNAMISDQIRRMEKIQMITLLGYDAKDMLLKHMRVQEDTEDNLARRYVHHLSHCPGTMLMTVGTGVTSYWDVCIVPLPLSNGKRLPRRMRQTRSGLRELWRLLICSSWTTGMETWMT